VEDGRAASERVLAALAALTPAAVGAARWSGLRGRTPTRLDVIDAFAFPEGGVLALLSAGSDPAEPPIRLSLPLADDPPWIALHSLATRGGAVRGASGGRLVGRPGPPADGTIGGAERLDVGTRAPGAEAPRPVAVRASPGDQSHTSVIIGEGSILKLYRRLPPGRNPEAEVLAALAEVPDAPVPRWRGCVVFEAAHGGETEIAIVQDLVAGTLDAFEFLADSLAGWACGDGGPVSTEIAAAAGAATGRLHLDLAAIEHPGFGTGTANAAVRAAWMAAAGATLEAAVAAVGHVDEDLARRVAEAEPAIRRALRPLGDAAIPADVQRTHGDLHLGQVLATDAGVVLVDFEGDPGRPTAARRDLDTPLRDLAGFLRSLDHVARSGLRRARGRCATAGPEGETTRVARVAPWIEAARAAFLGAYATAIGDPAWAPDRALLRALVVEKELRELTYAADFLPGWLYAPTGGLRALLGPIVTRVAEDAPPGCRPGSGGPPASGDVSG
jgi:trehalose synthase-fused probable maltokinase